MSKLFRDCRSKRALSSIRCYLGKVIPHSLLVFFPSRCLLPLNLLCFAKFRLGVFLSKEGLRGKAFPFSRSILCLCCLSLFKMDLGKVLGSAELFLNSPDHPLNQRSTRRIIRCVIFYSGQESSRDCLKTPFIGQFHWPPDHPMIV